MNNFQKCMDQLIKIRTPIIIKGSYSLYLNGLINREPKDIDIIINNKFNEIENLETFNEIMSRFDGEVVVNSHLLKSFHEDRYVPIEWVTKNNVSTKYIKPYKNNLSILNPEIAAYQKIFQIYFLYKTTKKEDLLKSDKANYVISDINLIFSNEYVISDLKKNLSEITNDEFRNSFYSAIAGYGTLTAYAFYDDEFIAWLKNNGFSIDFIKFIEYCSKAEINRPEIEVAKIMVDNRRSILRDIFMSNEIESSTIRHNVFNFISIERLSIAVKNTIKLINNLSNKRRIKNIFNLFEGDFNIGDSTIENIELSEIKFEEYFDIIISAVTKNDKDKNTDLIKTIYK